MKSIKINLFLIFAIANFLIPVKSGELWDKTKEVMPGCVPKATADYVAKRMWIYSNIAYCPERQIDAQTCTPCQENNEDLDDYAKSWSQDGAFVYVYYDKILKKVVVTFRGTEGIGALTNWRTNLDFSSTVVQCKPLKAVTRLARKNKNKQTKNKLKTWPFGNEDYIDVIYDVAGEAGAYVKQQTMDAGTYLKQKTVDAGAAVKDTTLAAGAAVKDTTLAAGAAVIDTTLAAGAAIKNQAVACAMTAANGAKNVVIGTYQIVEHTSQLTIGTPLQFVRQSIGNTYYRTVQDDYACFIHHGFWGMAQKLMTKKIFIQTKWYTIEEYIIDLYKANAGANGVSFTGHSLGGAMATVAASSYLYKQIIKQNVGNDPDVKLASLYTYGSPQVGDHNFQKWFDDSSAALGILNFRFRQNNDAVTGSLGFTHLGNLIRYDAVTKEYTDCGYSSDAKDFKGEKDPACKLKTSSVSAGITDHGNYFDGEVLKAVVVDGKSKPIKCEIRDNTETAADLVYQLEKCALQQKEAKEAGLVSMNRFRKNHKKFFNVKRKQHILSNK